MLIIKKKEECGSNKNKKAVFQEKEMTLTDKQKLINKLCDFYYDDPLMQDIMTEEFDILYSFFKENI